MGLGCPLPGLSPLPWDPRPRPAEPLPLNTQPASILSSVLQALWRGAKSCPQRVEDFQFTTESLLEGDNHAIDLYQVRLHAACALVSATRMGFVRRLRIRWCCWQRSQFSPRGEFCWCKVL